MAVKLVPLLEDEWMLPGAAGGGSSSSSSLRQEVAVLSRLQHANIIRWVQVRPVLALLGCPGAVHQASGMPRNRDQVHHSVCVLIQCRLP